jgi:NADH-quinone oxidoreductase subunit A
VENFILYPPIAFFIIFAVVLLQGFFMGKMSAKGRELAGKRKAYASGEDVKEHRFQPDYRQFFSFAFFFTIMHVVALIVATVPKSPGAFILAEFFIGIAAIGLVILFRR